MCCFARCSSSVGVCQASRGADAEPMICTTCCCGFAQWLKTLPVQKANGEELDGPEQAVRTTAAYLGRSLLLLLGVRLWVGHCVHLGGRQGATPLCLAVVLLHSGELACSAGLALWEQVRVLVHVAWQHF